MRDNKKEKIAPFVTRIVEWFESDAIILLDRVLTDDPVEPEYSSNTAYNRLKLVVEFQNVYRGKAYSDVEDYLLTSGYTKKDVDLLNQKRAEEDARYPWRHGEE